MVFLVVLWRPRYPLSPRRLAELVLDRGFVFRQETVRSWEARVAPLLTGHLRARRRGKAGLKWHADETYVKVHGGWCYRYRAIDAAGNRVDSLPSEHQNRDAAQRFFRRALRVVGRIPEKVTTDGQHAFARPTTSYATTSGTGAGWTRWSPWGPTGAIQGSIGGTAGDAQGGMSSLPTGTTLFIRPPLFPATVPCS
jgi:transposase-like protein